MRWRKTAATSVRDELLLLLFVMKITRPGGKVHGFPPTSREQTTYKWLTYRAHVLCLSNIYLYIHVYTYHRFLRNFHKSMNWIKTYSELSGFLSVTLFSYPVGSDNGEVEILTKSLSCELSNISKSTSGDEPFFEFQFVIISKHVFLHSFSVITEIPFIIWKYISSVLILGWIGIRK